MRIQPSTLARILAVPFALAFAGACSASTAPNTQAPAAATTVTSTVTATATPTPVTSATFSEKQTDALYMQLAHALPLGKLDDGFLIGYPPIVCKALTQGVKLQAVLDWAIKNTSGKASPQTVASITGLAVSAYCPQFESQLGSVTH